MVAALPQVLNSGAVTRISETVASVSYEEPVNGIVATSDTSATEFNGSTGAVSLVVQSVYFEAVF
ncbi:hypothetical protein E1B28_000566 [Marasmius oreades]|uniref:Uncharacterized protein n=1 Tax=Marasmius oreades TaxID=181124 RepID=A0A9P7V1K1_9AGAR|nr:uncharacterized protein E1B28_000566 [Marasmius oreades]KAG7098650.1 hypothetical protein E1B28_000566 [Marasmius oreades]